VLALQDDSRGSRSTLIEKLRTVFDLESSGRVLIYSALVGVVAGLGAAFFLYALNWLQGYALGHVEGYYPPAAGTEPLSHLPHMPSNWLMVLLVPVLGGLVCGCIVYFFAPEAEGHGTDAMVKVFHSLRGRIRARVPFVKTIASVITIGTGGSAGREGPIAQIGAGFGSFLSGWLKLSDWERRMLILAGAAGGVGAVFRAPLGGALFAVEVLYASTAIEFSAIVPCVVASVVAYSVFASICGAGFAFTVPASLSFGGLQELPFYLVFAILCAAIGFLYIWCFYGVRDHFFRRLPIPNHVKPAIGGLFLGLIVLGFPQVMAGGYGWIQEAINGNLTLQLMAILVVAKILATSFTISSGGSGGVFAPSLFIGAMLGGAFGLICNQLFPGVAPPPAAFVLVGMGGFFAGVAKVPLTALIMVSEMSGSYDLLVPLMLVSVVTVAVLSSKWSLYEEQLPSLIDSPAHLGDYVVDVLEGIAVREIYDTSRCPTLIHEDTALPEILKVVSHGKESYFPVVDNHDELVGTSVATVFPEDNLHTTLRLCTQKNITEIPVVSRDNPRQVICMLRRQDVINAYDVRISALREGKPK